MTTEQKPKCSAELQDNFYASYSCSKPGTYTEEGKTWCGTHAPSKVAARRAGQDKKYDDRYAAITERDRRAAAEKSACAGISTEALEGGVIGELLAACEAVESQGTAEGFVEIDLRAVIAKARGTA